MLLIPQTALIGSVVQSLLVSASIGAWRHTGVLKFASAINEIHILTIFGSIIAERQPDIVVFVYHQWASARRKRW
jgi:hypothetical protein